MSKIEYVCQQAVLWEFNPKHPFLQELCYNCFSDFLLFPVPKSILLFHTPPLEILCWFSENVGYPRM